MFKLLVYTYTREGMDGDRALHKSPYKDYQIILSKDNNTEVELAYINGYDNWRSHIKNPKIILNEVGVTTEKFEKFFEVKATGINLVKKITTTEEWEEESV